MEGGFAGEKAYELTGTSLPNETLEIIREHLVAIKGPLGTPIGKGHRSLNVALRQELDLYACVRPIRYFKGVSPLKEPEKTDITIFVKIQKIFMQVLNGRLVQMKLPKSFPFARRNGSGKYPFSRIFKYWYQTDFGRRSKRLIRSAIEYALEHQLKMVTLVHKGNIQKFTEGGFRKWGYELAKEEFATELAEGLW